MGNAVTALGVGDLHSNLNLSLVSPYELLAEFLSRHVRGDDTPRS